MNRRRITLVVVLVAVIAGVSLWRWYNQPAMISFNLTPSDSTLAIDGKALKLDQSNQAKLKAGSHRLTVSHKDYEDYSQTVVVERGRAATISMTLTPKNVGAFVGALKSQFTAIPTSPSGQDYTVSNVHYFENNTWAVGEIIYNEARGNAGLAVFQLVDGKWKLIATGTDFSGATNDFPKSVAGYLGG